MRGVEVVVVAACVVGDKDVWCWYVVVECGAGELFPMPAAASPALRAVLWGTRMWMVHASRVGSGPVGVDG